ncbi:hypothetical protein [Rhizobium sp. Rhizsp82]|uniref:hypothetical protein n=1 Tax=Rhizobium sp. Rhizsp82 TaxID=3243057 RepID=UPI0039B66568
MTPHLNVNTGRAHGLRQAALKTSGAMRRMVPVLALLAGGFLAGCQADGDGLSNTVKNTDIKAPSSDVEESFGETGAEITLLIPKGASGIYEGEARDIRDGAALGTGEVGNGQVFVKVIDVGSGPAAVASAVSAAKARNSALLVSFAPQATAAAVAAIPSADRPPLINLGAPVPTATGNVYNFVSDETDSAAEGARTAVAGGHKKVFVFATTELTAMGEAEISNAVRAGGGTYLGSARYALSDASAADAVAKSKAQMQGADTVVVLGKSVIVTTVAGAIKAAGFNNITLVGTSGWPQQSYTSPSVQGALIAMVDPEGASMISERYQRHYRRPLTANAAYGYDAVAIASGIIRTKDAKALTAENLTSKTGFRGITGLFRLNASGGVERKLSLFTLTGGKPNLFVAAPKAF